MTCIQIEDFNGNTIGAILTNKDIEIINFYGFDMADKEDYDDIFGTNDMKIRIQLNEE